MERKAVSAIIRSLLLTSMLTLAFNIQLVRASGTIYIRPDGSVDPSTAPIHRDGDVYTFTDNIYNSIVVERDNIVVNGAGYRLQGASIAGIILEGRSNVTISDMEIEAFGYGISLRSSSNNSVYGNNITNTDYIGISLANSLNNSIFSNTLRNNGIYGIHILGYSNYNSISGNNITHSEIGIWHQSSSHNIISGNNMANNFIDIDFTSSSNIISGNIMTNATHASIRLAVSKHNIISGNTIANSGFAGLLLDGSKHNIISSNTLTDSDIGMYLVYWGTNNTIYGNDIVNNNRGVVLSSSSNDNNTFFHNNFVGNTQQIVSYDSTNLWDNGYPSGGNYWSDYNVTDLFSGTYQNETGSDGIGDTPYVIDADKDNYPLMKPWTPNITATIDINPNTLNSRSKRKWISVNIELPEDYNVRNIDVNTILLEGSIPADWINIQGDVLMAKFNKTEVSSYIYHVLRIEYGNVTLKVSGQLYIGTHFEGSDTIKVIFR